MVVESWRAQGALPLRGSSSLALVTERRRVERGARRSPQAARSSERMRELQRRATGRRRAPQTTSRRRRGLLGRLDGEEADLGEGGDVGHGLVEEAEVSAEARPVHQLPGRHDDVHDRRQDEDVHDPDDRKGRVLRRGWLWGPGTGTGASPDLVRLLGLALHAGLGGLGVGALLGRSGQGDARATQACT